MNPATDYSIELLLLKALESLVTPPGLFCVLILGSLVFHQTRFAAGLLVFTVALIYVSALPATQQWLGRFAETRALSAVEQKPSQAIVVLGGGRHINTPDYGGDTVNALTLERLRYAAIVQRQTGLPILVSGGKPFLGTLSEAALMRDILDREFLGVVKWAEDQSRTTYENAQFSARILKAAGVRGITLITHAYHMPRAAEAFRRTGLTVTPAATVFFDRKPKSAPLILWLPNLTAFFWNNMMLHELIGRLWYHVRYYRTEPDPPSASG